MLPLLLTTFVGSIIGSLHCLTMCGPLLATLAEPGRSASLRLAAWHSAGRLVIYAALGSTAGLVGRAFDVATRLGNFQRGAAIVSAVVLVGFAVVTIWPRAVGAAAVPKVVTHALVQLRARRSARTAGMLGLVTGLLPCGWLWAFVVTAAGTGSVALGGLVMVAFWLGTLPAMMGLLSVAGPVVVRLRTHRPLLMGAVLVGLGLFTLWQRWPNAGAAGVAAPSCHDVAGGAPQ